ncbi:MAG TPA: pitrilysin family protein [Candidatus Limnocylindria bacterium]|nr:pitrilysin family protein [Candidatus Limnocylindria bacterium]
MIRRARAQVGPLRVVVAEIPGLRSVVTSLGLDAGQLAEMPGRPGIGRLTAQTMLRGTTKRSAQEWTQAIDALGASSRLDVSSQQAVFHGQCLAGDLAPYLALVAEAVLHARLAEEDLEFVRQQTLAQLEEDSKDTRAVADATWRALAYPVGHPFHTRTIGSEEVVRSATVDELRRFYDRNVIGSEPLLIIAGGVSEAAAIDAARSAFAGWRKGPARPAPSTVAASLASTVRQDVVVPDKTQCDVVLGWHGLPRTDPRYVAARVTNMVFAQDTFASRAGNVVRDQLGLAYYVFSTLGISPVAAPWAVRMGVNPENVTRAIDTTFAELRKIHEGEVASDDFELAKDKLVGELEVALESPQGVAQMVLEAELFDLGDDHFERYPAQLRAVTLDEVVQTARSFLPLDRYALAVAGPPLAA